MHPRDLRCLFVLVALNLAACANVPSAPRPAMLADEPVIDTEDFASLDIQEARPGRAIRLEFQDAMIMTDYGPSAFALVALPQREDSAVLNLRSYLTVPGYPGMTVSPEVFAPQVQLLDANFRPLGAPAERPAWRRGSYEAYYVLEILSEPKADYLLVYTDPRLLGVELKVERGDRDADAPFAVQSHAWRDGLNYTATGEVELAVPAPGEYHYVERAHGWSLDFGASFGGERLIEATAGSDSIHAGSGVIATLNYHFPVSDDGRWGVMLGGGLLYHPADTYDGRAEISAWVAEATLVYTSTTWRTRAGVSVDFAPEFNAPPTVASREFETAFGPVAMIEWRVVEDIWLGLRVEHLEYEDSDSGERFDAANIGAIVNVSF